MADVRPRQFGDVNQAVHAVEVDEGAEVDDVRDLSLDNVAGVEAIEDALPLVLALLFEDGATREDDVVARAVELDHLRAELLAEKLVEILHAANVHERRRQEAADAEVENQPALDDLDDATGDGLARLRCSLDPLPRQFEARSLLGQDQAAFRVLLREDERVDLLADLNLVRGIDGAANRQLRNRDDTLRLVADVDENLVLVDTHDGAVHDLPLVDLGESGVVIGDAFAVRADDPDAVVSRRRRHVACHLQRRVSIARAT